ncbi:HD domain-containing protein [Streptomyces sp. NPDC086777]|uniref:HD domain-containing protein n=1 Tax=Streptomyces sp. NPDC086777 TaxID=3154866 RepID=UPI00344F45D1
MNDALALPSSPLATAVMSEVRSLVHPSLVNHCVRSFLWARLYGEYLGALNDAAYDEDLLFAACVAHDLGTSPLAQGKLRFEVEGADLAAALVTRLGVSAADADRVWEAIALHTSPQIAEKRGLLTVLAYEGIYIDFGKNADLVSEWAERIHDTYPRLKMARTLTDMVLAHAALSEGAAPRYGIAWELVRERAAEGMTFMERAVAAGPWGE